MTFQLLTGHLLRARERQVTLWGGRGGVKHVKMTLFSAKIFWTSPLRQQCIAHGVQRSCVVNQTSTRWRQKLANLKYSPRQGASTHVVDAIVSSF